MSKLVDGLKHLIPSGVMIVGAIASIIASITALKNNSDGIKTLAILIFNVPIIIVAARLPFVSSLRAALREKGPAGPIESTSYSRVTGLFGAVMVTSLFWAVGNIVIWYLFDDIAKAEKIVDSVWKLFVLGSALFLPYAFNQLRTIMVDTQKQTVEMERLKLAPGVTVPGKPGTKVLKNDPPSS